LRPLRLLASRLHALPRFCWVGSATRLFDRYLLAKADVSENAKALAVPAECEDYLQERSRLLDWRLRCFANALRHDRLKGVAAYTAAANPAGPAPTIATS
jgi:hypothetical protein